MKHLAQIIQQLEPISLEEMDSVKLMNRTDTKFTMNAALLPGILEQCKNDYRILEVKSVRAASYKTLYFDTHNISFFTDHHNERPSRYKVRIRNYVESGLFFLEIKHKKEGRTIKSRIKIKGFEPELSPASREFISKTIGIPYDLTPMLWNHFSRITLVNKKEKERLTIDHHLAFDSNGKQLALDSLVIAEVKQERINRNSKFIRLMREYCIRETGISKYCLGTVLTNPMAKYNNFKAKILTLNKIMQAA
ncbi:MAG: polyphosphate polymerase domain-containing protein [Bacteroidota bacterium]